MNENKAKFDNDSLLNKKYNAWMKHLGFDKYISDEGWAFEDWRVDAVMSKYGIRKTELT